MSLLKFNSTHLSYIGGVNKIGAGTPGFTLPLPGRNLAFRRWLKQTQSRGQTVPQEGANLPTYNPADDQESSKERGYAMQQRCEKYDSASFQTFCHLAVG